jgi:hypothetical protein
MAGIFPRTAQLYGQGREHTDGVAPDLRLPDDGLLGRNIAKSSVMCLLSLMTTPLHRATPMGEA